MPTLEKQQTVPGTRDAVGQSVHRADGVEKVKGEGVYYGDLSMPNLLHGRVLRSRSIPGTDNERGFSNRLIDATQLVGGATA